jgi:hypothetical protein
VAVVIPEVEETLVPPPPATLAVAPELGDVVVVAPARGVVGAVCAGVCAAPPVLAVVCAGAVPVRPPDAVVVDVEVDVDVDVVVDVPVDPVFVPSVELAVVLVVPPLESGSLVLDVPVDVPPVEDALVVALLVLVVVLDVLPPRGSPLVPVLPVEEMLVNVLVDVPVKSAGAARVVVNVGTVVTTGVGVSTTGGGAGGGGATAVVIDSAPSK